MFIIDLINSNIYVVLYNNLNCGVTMKKYLALTFFFFLLIAGCSNDPVSPPEVNKSGSILFKIDRLNAPSNVQTVTAILSRNGFENISSTMNLLSDTTADLELINIPAGTWHLVVNAKDSLGTVVYTGETNVNIVELMTIQVSLVLQPVSVGTGNIYLYVTWGTNQNLNWTDIGPVFSQCPGEPVFVNQGKVIYDANKYKMYYNAVYNSAVSTIWYAESFDGINWSSPLNTPVLNPGSYSWDSHGVVIGAVVKDNSGYKMFFTGTTSGYGVWSIGMALSNDGVNWQKISQPILSPEPGTDKIGVTSVILVDGTYYLYYSTYTNIYLATSTDGLTWTKYNQNPILGVSLQWENNYIHYPSVVFDGTGFQMVYMGGNRTEFGRAYSSDGKNWTKDLQPVITMNNIQNHWCQIIEYPNLGKFQNELRLYYTGTISGYNIKIGMLKKSF
jgi:predicted GH43/DUF377 family glycosyl hydrolase